MKPPFRWSKAIAPAAYDFFLAAFVLGALCLTGPRAARGAAARWTTEPLGVLVAASFWVLLGTWALVQTPRRLSYLVGAIRKWRRQRRRRTSRPAVRPRPPSLGGAD